MRGDTKLWLPERKSIVGHLARSSFVQSTTNGKLMLISYRFSHEATNITSYRFLFEATGKVSSHKSRDSPLAGTWVLKPYRSRTISEKRRAVSSSPWTTNISGLF